MWYWTVGYPINGFSQIGQWNEEVNEYNAKFESKWQNPDADTLKAMGESIFLVQCAPCHGVTADGIDGKAHDLTSRISKASVKHAIENGANNFTTAYPAGMPNRDGLFNTATGEAITDAEIEAVSTYVANGLKGDTGADVFANVCASCHGPDGNGMEYVAPSLKSYTDSLIASVLHDGKKANIGEMPNFQGRLNDTQIKAVANYLRSIGE
jgi:cytochrome c oxidase cbb3-type subunit 3